MTRGWNPEESWPGQAARGWGEEGERLGEGVGGVLGTGTGQWQRAEQRQGGCLELGGPSAVPRALAPVLLPSLHLPHFPSALPPHTPQGSRFRFAVESLRGLIPSSITLHPCGGWRFPCLFPQSWVSPPPPPRPPPTLLTIPFPRTFCPSLQTVSHFPCQLQQSHFLPGQPFLWYSSPPSLL